MTDPITPVSVCRESADGLTRTVWRAAVTGYGAYSLDVYGIAQDRPSRRHRWRFGTSAKGPPPDVRLELAEALCRQVRAAMGVEP